MLKFKSNVPRYLHSVSIFDLPAHMQEGARDWGNNCDEQLDYQDGDFYVVLDFKDILADLTEDSVLQATLDGDLPEEDYPFAWQEEADDFEGYAARKRWADVTRYIAQNLPAELVAENKVALYLWH